MRTLLLSCNRLSLSPLPLENGASDLPLNRMCELGRVILPLLSMWMLMLIADLWLKKRCVQIGAPRFCVVHLRQFSRQRFVGGRPVHLNGASKHPLLGFISKGRCRFWTCRNWDTLLDCWFDDKRHNLHWSMLHRPSIFWCGAISVILTTQRGVRTFRLLFLSCESTKTSGCG